MGTWHATCGLSHLPILEGDKIAAFIVEEKNGDGCFQVSSLPVFASYNELGSIKQATRNHVEVLQAMNPTLEKTFRSCENLFSAVSNYTFEDLHLFMVHEQVYLDILQELEIRDELGIIALDFAASIPASLLEINQKAEKFRLDYLQKVDSSSEPFVLDVIEKMTSQNRDIDLTRLEHANPLYRFFVKNERLFPYVSSANAQELSDLFLFDTALSLLRMSWAPPTGRGSVSNEMKLHRILAKSIIEHEQNIRFLGIDTKERVMF